LKRNLLYLAGVLALTMLTSCTLPTAPSFRGAESNGDAQTVRLAGNVPPLACAEFDAGAVSANLHLERMVLVLAPSAEQQTELDALVAAQQDPNSPQYHQWLTPDEFGARFGVSDAQLAEVTAWLSANGFAIDEVPPGRRLVLFSGTAGQVSNTFHTAIRYYRVNGSMYISNAQDPQIPNELAGLVAGVVTLNDFGRASQIASARPMAARSEYSAGATHRLFPADFATIYDLNPLYGAGIDGSGTAIAIAGRSNIDLNDVASFRSLAGLVVNTPSVIVDGSDPGLVSSDQVESTLGVEWAGAVAPAAQVNLVVAASTGTTNGIDLASAYIVNHATAPVMSVTYSTCEQEMGTTELAFYDNLWEQAASEGISVFVASGDAGAAGCQAPDNAAGSADAVNGLCTSPYATCVGGTEFNEGADAAEFWSATNSLANGSALGYIPERVWNESALDDGTGFSASGGGASTVYEEPIWQQNVNGTEAAGGMRAVPDVSLSAADHDGYFVIENGKVSILSGTSFSAPAFAGVIALVNQKEGAGGQGSVNARLYALANAAPNLFHPTPTGNNSVPGVEGYAASGATYNLATGLGSVDGALLVNGWNSSSAAGVETPTVPPTLILTAAAQQATVAEGGSAMVQFSVVTGGSFTGNVSLSVGGLPDGVTAAWLASPLGPAFSVGSTGRLLRITAARRAAVGASNLTVTATGDGVTSTQTITVTVMLRANECARFSLMPTSCRSLPRQRAYWNNSNDAPMRPGSAACCSGRE
jgi:pseudomonalisin